MWSKVFIILLFFVDPTSMMEKGKSFSIRRNTLRFDVIKLHHRPWLRLNAWGLRNHHKFHPSFPLLKDKQHAIIRPNLNKHQIAFMRRKFCAENLIPQSKCNLKGCPNRYAGVRVREEMAKWNKLILERRDLCAVEIKLNTHTVRRINKSGILIWFSDHLYHLLGRPPTKTHNNIFFQFRKAYLLRRKDGISQQWNGSGEKGKFKGEKISVFVTGGGGNEQQLVINYHDIFCYPFAAATERWRMANLKSHENQSIANVCQKQISFDYSRSEGWGAELSE